VEQELPQRQRSISHWLASLWESESPVLTIRLGSLPWPKYRRSTPGLFSSFLLHFSVIFLLVRFPIAKFLAQPNTPSRTEHVVYMLHPLNLADYFPTLKPPGPGGKPGQGNRPNRPPARGSTAFHPTLTIISNPPHPDNSRQTIVQSNSPPELKIPHEIRLPNILIGATVPPPPAPRPPPPAPAAPKPIETHVVVPSRAPTPLPAAPALALVAPPNPLLNPALPVPLPAPPAPPSAPSPPTPPPQPSRTSEAKALDELDTRRTPSSGAGLLSLSVEPAPSAESVALPPGNRQGAFSISPAGGKEGSPGGVPGGDALGGGAGGNGPAGDASTGLGSGDKGGGGGGKGAPGEASSSGSSGTGGSGGGAGPIPGASVSISGAPGSNKDGVLPSFFAATAVYPVTPPGPRRPMMVVTSGPTGGGGLQVYGVLRGKKIYTIYLPMPDKNWILQYCARDSSGATQDRERPSVEIQLEVPIVPPAAVEQFDFHRPPVPAADPSRRDMIILQGVILEDGSVGELKVYKGFGVVDQAALAAFNRWKFRPAQRSNKPIAVEILVGIPVVLPTT